MEPHLILNLKPFKISEDIWEYLKKVYHQDNSAWQCHLECKIAHYTQGILTIQEYYFGFRTLWFDFDNIKYAIVSIAVLSVLQELQASSQWDQFLMKLRSDYENMRSTRMSRVSSPSLDSCLAELLCEEEWLLTKTKLEQQNYGNLIVAYYAQRKHPHTST